MQSYTFANLLWINWLCKMVQCHARLEPGMHVPLKSVYESVGREFESLRAHHFFLDTPKHNFFR